MSNEVITILLEANCDLSKAHRRIVKRNDDPEKAHEIREILIAGGLELSFECIFECIVEYLRNQMIDRLRPIFKKMGIRYFCVNSRGAYLEANIFFGDQLHTSPVLILVGKEIVVEIQVILLMEKFKPAPILTESGEIIHSRSDCRIELYDADVKGLKDRADFFSFKIGALQVNTYREEILCVLLVFYRLKKRRILHMPRPLQHMILDYHLKY